MTTKDFMMEPQQRKCNGCNSDCAYFEKMNSFLLETFARQILYKNSDIVKHAEEKNAENYIYNIVQVHAVALRGLPDNVLGAIQLCNRLLLM